MDSLVCSIAVVDPAEFTDLEPLSPATLAEQLETMRVELAEFEAWLGSPPAKASAEYIETTLVAWATCYQWISAYQMELFKKQQEIAALDEELAEVRGLLRGLDGEMQRSHDEMAAADIYWDELDRRENRILGRLEELGAPLPSEDQLAAAKTPKKDTRSHIQRGLDDEWDSANFAGPGCPFCDSLFGCSCWVQRAEAREAEERRRVRAARAEVAARAGVCACDALSEDSQCPYPSLCEVCQREEELRCRECGGLPCRADCCGGCGSCTRCCGSSCKRCGDFESNCRCWEDDEEDDYDPSDPYGDGAPEEHEGHPGYDGW
jgi:hypothetical protein